MDKVKKILEQLQKYHFWILCGVGALIGLISWVLASGALSTEFTANKTAIEGEFNKLNLPADQPHAEWPPQTTKTTDEQRKNVQAAWEKLRNQQSEKVFVWPEDKDANGKERKEGLSKEFRDEIQKIEASKEKIELSDKLREEYMRKVPEQVMQLATLVDSQPFNPTGGPGQVAQVQPTNPNAGPLVPTNRVSWDVKSQQDIWDSFTWEKAPTTLMIRYMQEELWVYKALCDIVAEMNKGSKGPFDASVREIDDLAIAYNAVQDPVHGGSRRWTDTLVPTAADAAGTSTDAGKNKFKPEERGKEPVNGGGGAINPDAGAPANPEDAWKGGRYVNDAGAAVDGAAVDTADTEYNLMPFRLILRIDAREIDKLLVLFRNSALPFEVQEVRVNGTSGSGPNQGVRAPINPAPAANGPGQAYDHFVTLELHG
ncbi:MAG TPA: hypothetical protein VGJ15_09105, partial [Pirellulales bacterium]